MPFWPWTLASHWLAMSWFLLSIAAWHVAQVFVSGVPLGGGVNTTGGGVSTGAAVGVAALSPAPADGATVATALAPGLAAAATASMPTSPSRHRPVVTTEMRSRRPRFRMSARLAPDREDGHSGEGPDGPPEGDRPPPVRYRGVPVEEGQEQQHDERDDRDQDPDQPGHLRSE